MKKILAGLVLLAPAWSAVCADTIVASVKPLHSLVQTVAAPAKVELLLEAGASPHHSSLKPSQMRSLQQASVVFYIDQSFESFLHRALKALPAKVRTHAVAREAGLTLLPVRKEGAWQAHQHHSLHEQHGNRPGHHEHDHDEEQTDGHEHEHEQHGNRPGHHEHDHDEEQTDGHEHEHEQHGDTPGDYNSSDMHVWLDMENAVRIVQFIARKLGAVNPAGRGMYEANAAAFAVRAAEVDAQLRDRLAAVTERPFIVFHDAYQYFERRYGLTAVGSIAAHPGRPLSVHAVRQLRDKIKHSGAVCVFREPQFSDKAISTVIRDGSVKIGVLDPLGAGLQSGAGMYFDLLIRLGQNARSCLL